MAFLLYLAGLIGFGASSILASEYLRHTAVFCAEGGGCDVVRESAYAHLGPIPTPFFGILFFAVALVLALWPARRALVVWATGGAIAALGFFAIQAFVLHAFCKYCVAADTSALVLCGLAWATRKQTQPPKTIFAVAVGALAAGLALAPMTVKPPPPPPQAELAGPVPDVIVRQQQPGVATIIEFVDFECPFCRRLHHTMEEVLADYSGKVKVIRKQLPLPSLHAHAMDAARAACCADEVGAAGAGDKMADALFSAPPDDLTPEGCEKLAAKVGVDLEAYRACMASDRPRKRIEADGEEAKAAGLTQSVPVFFVGGKVFKGAQPAPVIRAAIDRELARR
jgi:protein-disulfide isomerase